MAYYNVSDLTNKTLVDVATFCAMAAYKAPQITHQVKILAEIVTGEDIQAFIDILGVQARNMMVAKGDHITIKTMMDKGTPPVILFIGGAGVSNADLNWNCGACGFRTCKEMSDYARENTQESVTGNSGPLCIWKSIDVAVAMDAAAAAASQFHVENRAMGSLRSAGKLLGYMKESDVSVGFAIGPCEEEIYYNRPTIKNVYNEEEMMEFIYKLMPSHFIGFPAGGDPRVKYGDQWEKNPLYVRKAPREKEYYFEMEKQKKEIETIIKNDLERRFKGEPNND